MTKYFTKGSDVREFLRESLGGSEIRAKKCYLFLKNAGLIGKAGSHVWIRFDWEHVWQNRPRGV